MTLMILLLHLLAFFPRSLRKMTTNQLSHENLRLVSSAGDRNFLNLIKNKLIKKCRPGHTENDREKTKENRNKCYQWLRHNSGGDAYTGPGLKGSDKAKPLPSRTLDTHDTHSHLKIGVDNKWLVSQI